MDSDAVDTSSSGAISMTSKHTHVSLPPIIDRRSINNNTAGPTYGGHSFLVDTHVSSSAAPPLSSPAPLLSAHAILNKSITDNDNIKSGSSVGKSKVYSETSKGSKSLKQKPLKQQVLDYLEYICEHPSFVGLMGLFTIWALFEDDIRLAACTKEADTAFETIISIAFFSFIFEIIASCFYKKDYIVIPKWEGEFDENLQQTWTRRLTIGGFYFWLDVGATLTLITELHWMLAADNGPQIQGGNATNAGVRAGRVVRLVRMVRLVRLVKLYKYGTVLKEKRIEDLKRRNGSMISSQELLSRSQVETTLTSIREDEEEEDDDDEETAVTNAEFVQTESQVGSKMSDTTNRRVIVLVLSLIIVVPFLSVEDPDTSLQLSSYLLHNLYIQKLSDSSYVSIYKSTIDQLILNGMKILQVTIDGNVAYTNQATITSLRASETILFQISENNLNTNVLYSDYDNSKASAQNSIYTTLFIIGCLSIAMYLFTNDVYSIIVHPLEQMVKIIKNITEDPMGVKIKMLGEEQGFRQGMETTILLSTILKIVGMMRVSFGEAGGPIIAESLMNFSGKLDVIGLGGKLISSIFGFCDVRQFTDTTECLQEEVMIFVNRIAHILHSITVQCHGLPNKNIGDAFLLTWKLPKNATDKEMSFLADQALLCFCKALIELSRYEDFIIDFSISATSRLHKRFPNYHVRIGSGLHMGWAIEGAIGTNSKIDASYLSPHVNTTEFLESSTKAYGVALLISEPFYKLLSPAAQKYVRQVDCVKKSTKADPFGMYTYDSDLTIDWPSDYDNGMSKNIYKKKINVTQKLFAQKAAQKWMKKTETSGKARIVPTTAEDPKKKTQKNQEEFPKRSQAPSVLLTSYDESVWDEDYDLVQLRRNVSESFRLVWQTGIDAYLKGDWQKAAEIFTNTLKLTGGKDGPSKFLIEYMKEHDNQAPSDWQGWRDESGGGH